MTLSTDNISLTIEQQADMLRSADFTPEQSMVWETPIPFEAVEISEFPVDDLPATISDYVKAVAETTQTPPDMAATASLAILALCLQGKFMIEGKKDWIEPLNLYIIIVANPGERKSAVVKHMTIPIREYETEENARLEPIIERNNIEKSVLDRKKKMMEDFIVQGKAEKSEIDEIVREINEFDEVRPCRLFYDDITPQKLAGVLSENGGRTAILSSEGGIFDILAGKYSNGMPDIDIFLKAHSGDSIRVDRMGRGSNIIDNPAMTTLLFVQPTIIENLMSNGIFQGRGLCARFLYSMPKSKLGSREFDCKPISETMANEYNNLIKSLLRLKPTKEPAILKLSELAYKKLKMFFEHIECMLNEELSPIQGFAGKMTGAVLRISGILHIANTIGTDISVVSEDEMISAMRIGMYFLEHADRAFKIVVSDESVKNAEYVLEKVLKNKISRATKTELVRICRKFKSTEQLSEPLNLLIRHNYIKEFPQEHNGAGRRTDNIYIVNPQIL